jgi:hypothetical protein
MKTNRTLYGILAFGPIGLVLLGVSGTAVYSASENVFPGSGESTAWMLWLGVLLSAGLLSIACLVMNLFHISQNNSLGSGARMGWIIGMVFAHSITSILYFFIHILNAPPDPMDPAGSDPQHPRHPDPWDTRHRDPWER